MDELYGIHSVTYASDYSDAIVEEDGSVLLEWYCAYRPQPIADYETLIKDYAALGEPYKSNAERYMDELFTREEVNEILPYLCFTYGHLVGISTVPVPMDIWLADGHSMANPVSTILEN